MSMDPLPSDLSQTNADKLRRLWDRAQTLREEMQDHLQSLQLARDAGVCVLPARAHTLYDGRCSCRWFESKRQDLLLVEREARDLMRSVGMAPYRLLRWQGPKPLARR